MGVTFWPPQFAVDASLSEIDKKPRQQRLCKSSHTLQACGLATLPFTTMKVLISVISLVCVCGLAKADTRLRGNFIGTENLETQRFLGDGKDCCVEVCEPSSSKRNSKGSRDLGENCHLDCSACDTDCCECEYKEKTTSGYDLVCACDPNCPTSSKSIKSKSSFSPKARNPKKTKSVKGVKTKASKLPKGFGSTKSKVKGNGGLSKISNKSKGSKEMMDFSSISSSKSHAKPSSPSECFPTDIFTDRDGCDCECHCCADAPTASSKAKESKGITKKSLKSSKVKTASTGERNDGSSRSRELKGAISSKKATFTCGCRCSCKASSKSSAKSNPSKASKSKKGGSSKSSSKSSSKGASSKTPSKYSSKGISKSSSKSSNKSSKGSTKTSSSKSSSKASAKSSSKRSSKGSSSNVGEGGQGCCEYKELCSGDQSSECDKVCIKYGC